MSNLKRILFVLLSVSLFAVACDKQEGGEEKASAEEAAPAAEEKVADEAAADEGAADQAKAEGDELAMVDVPADGKEFDPPVEPEQIPAGAWYCDMGTVHYAQIEKGDATCPLCHMKLKQKAAEGGEAGAADHADHDHGEHMEGEHGHE